MTQAKTGAIGQINFKELGELSKAKSINSVMEILSRANKRIEEPQE